MTHRIKSSRCTYTIQKIIHDRHNTGGYNSSGNGGPIRLDSTFRCPTVRHNPDASALPLRQRWTRLKHNFDRRATFYWILLLVVPEELWGFLPKPFRPWQFPRSDPASDSNSVRRDRSASTRARQAAPSIFSSGTTRLPSRSRSPHHLLPPFDSWCTCLDNRSTTVPSPAF